MSSPLLPADLQRDVDMCADDIRSFSIFSSAAKGFPPRTTTSISGVASESLWQYPSLLTSPLSELSICGTPPIHSSLSVQSSPPLEEGGFGGSSSDAQERSETSLSSAIAAISAMAAVASESFSAGGEAAFVGGGGGSTPSFGEAAEGEPSALAPTATTMIPVAIPEHQRPRRGGESSANSQPVLEKPNHFSSASDSTATSPDLGIHALLRILTPTHQHMLDHTSHTSESLGQRSRMESFTNNGGGASDKDSEGMTQQTGFPPPRRPPLTPPPPSAESLGEHRGTTLTEKGTNPTTSVIFGHHPHSFKATVIPSLSEIQQRPGSQPSMTTMTMSCTDLRRQPTEDEDRLVEAARLHHGLTSSVPRASSHAGSQIFHSPSSTTFLNKAFGAREADAREALKRLLECFSPGDDSGLPGPSSVGAMSPGHEERPPRMLLPLTERGGPSGDTSASGVPPPGTFLPTQESLSPDGPPELHQGSMTAPAAMITDAQAMLANLLSSLGADDPSDNNTASPKELGQSLVFPGSLDSFNYDWRPPGDSRRAGQQAWWTAECQLPVRGPLPGGQPPQRHPPDLPYWRRDLQGRPNSDHAFQRPPADWSPSALRSFDVRTNAPASFQPTFPLMVLRPQEPRSTEAPGGGGGGGSYWAYPCRDFEAAPSATAVAGGGGFHGNLPLHDMGHHHYDYRIARATRTAGAYQSIAVGSHNREQHVSVYDPYTGCSGLGGNEHADMSPMMSHRRVYCDDRDRMAYVSWIPKKARAYNTIDKRKMELDLKRKLREELGLIGLTKVLLFPPKGVHCKLIFDTRESATHFMTCYGGENRSDETERWKVDLCRIYKIDMHDKFDKTVVKIEWSARG